MMLKGTSNSPLRWYSKKAARKGLALTSWATGALIDSQPRKDGPRIRVLTYHRFGEIARDPFCVRSIDFRRQMALLAEHGRIVSLTHIERLLSRKRDTDSDAILVTIDDGFRSVYTEALPILREYKIPAVAFVTIDSIGRARETTQSGDAYLTWDQIALLAEAGVTIGSHSLTHRSLGKMSRSEVEEEVARSREILRQRTGAAVEAFAYPYGTLADFNGLTQRIIEQSGYTCAFTSQHGTIRMETDRFSLPRVKVEGGEGLWWFSLIARGGLDAWSWVDRNLWRLQASGYGD
jgi:peptidoglycan/xylan/chitin deacetylase (PgdA/CDA1 family)